MPINSSPEFSNVERDPVLLMWFMTLVVAGMYAITLYNEPATRQLGTLLPFSLLTFIHIILHWQMGKIAAHPSKLLWYIVIQGVLALVISMFARNFEMAFALFMALIGQAVGLFGLTRRGLLAGVFYLVLLVVSLMQFSGWASSIKVLWTIIPMTIFVVIYVALYMRQHEAREQAQILAAKLETANRQLSEYAAQVEDLTIANERQRMARELHDTLSQGLAGIILQLEAIEAHLGSNRPEKAKTIVGNTMLQARATLSDARAAIDDLRNSSADDLDSALRLEISRFTSATGIPCDYRADPIKSLPDPVKETLIRAVSEGLTNIARHAQAQRAGIEVRVVDQKRKSLSITIQDDGQGFDASEIPSGHYGLLGIRERVRLAKGSFDIHREAGVGTTLKIKIPL
jgi:two-component system, NarL family, sensor histidine kinase YdfH